MKTLRRFRPYFPLLKPVRIEFVIALLCGLAAGALSGAGIPVLLYKVVPVVFQDHDLTTGDLWFYCLLPAMVMGARGIFSFYNLYLLGFCGQSMLEQLRVDLFAKLQRLPLGFYHKNPPGELVSRAMQDTNLVQQSLIVVAQEIVKQPATLASAIGFLAFLSMKHSQVAYLLIFIIAIPICIVPIRLIGKKLKKKATILQFELAETTNRICQNLEATQEIRAYNLEERETTRFRESAQRVSRGFLKMAKYNIVLSPIIEFIGALGIGAGLYYTYQSRIDEGAFTALLAALFLCYDPVKRLGQLNNRMQEGLAGLERVEHILHEDEPIRDPENPQVLPDPVRGEVAFEKVSFAYAEAPVLRSVSVKLEPGKTYALVGSSGAGKTTFANLILRYYDVVDGRVTVDGLDVRAITQHDLREQISVVAQSPVLFNDTVRGNIAVGKLGVSDEAIEEAARKAYAHDFISAMTDGYATEVGPSGARLSGGQRQRIALARAFLKDSPILILDEATSALDAESERFIQLAMEDLARKKTVIVIAHRFSSIQRADEILVFEAGQIVDQGSHDELLHRGGVYGKLYKAQSLDG
ncbi:ABC transporter ATP-binding protein [Cerasicoccus arenae]|uniref:Lipid A export permease/ATP-binding protein MsbA n=1 Tax=Cerasicoccus arenae TaxID=424488 RepID=A0A8J3D8S1_9BACT|nr:ABC transporter ATP-binding protein [Cerasicoccus arenae]MBK1856951.1 ABC transporter ATP-binding protein [Cerasicoccus arenae]GHB90006.1 lipid A export permease/ATP-binding protein MsbA [Cerasicoccus arenae]